MANTPKQDASRDAAPTAPDTEVVIIGTGVGGICAAVRLKQAGVKNFVILERAEDIGGTWRDNVYPGVAVDIPSISYQYSFFPNPNWSRVFAPGDEVQAYHQRVVDHFGIRPHVHFGVTVLSEEWDEANHLWRLRLEGGSEFTARFVISAVGPFFEKKGGVDIPGIDDFAGTTVYPGKWKPEYDIRGKRVAVIGTGATGVQLAGHIAPEIGEMTVFQRTPVYCVPKPDFAIPKPVQTILRLPGLVNGIRSVIAGVGSVGLLFAIHTPGFIARPAMRVFDTAVRAVYRRYLKAVVKNDPDAAEKLLPSFGIFGNRPTLNSTFPRAFNQENVHLVTTPIERIVPEGVRTTDGVVHEVDVLITATGFKLFSEPSSYEKGRVIGNGVDLSDFFHEQGMKAYESVSVPGFPNRWIIVGPYSWTGGIAWHDLVDNAVVHIVRAISLAKERKATRSEVRAEACEAFHQKMIRQGHNIRWYFVEKHKGIHSYWKNADGDAPLIRPTTIWQAHKASREFPADDYAYSTRATAGQTEESAAASAR
ncbi:flavin-containing monooxygenase [Segniliparus rugosus]|uniref:Monooxygenase n=1 Tax=Segniliparus rugosus (strain ATCC BAA-974 / DSM 45345 / CCUG 50838 / CIP 108380 / JCM 13579 / CDC 945) TaxID=679197 RepID=E5XR71_SEGRC|nr:NAD(P)/FAD-dependent oxidoreductase [Segniliparus rugosus]EFV13164.1 hypothetical protein HMPREF9336_01993 [Segniliparus rugosus ATCC BAA-974]